jgi:hypothetical protein
MGVEYMLVDDTEKEYVRLGKLCHSDDAGENWDCYQMPAGKVVAFIAGRQLGSVVRVVTDGGEDFDKLADGYELVASWDDGLD